MPSTKTLRVTLQDIIGATGGSGSTADVKARYVASGGTGRDVHLISTGAIVVPVRRTVTPGTGPEHFDFTVIPSDDPDVRDTDRGFLTEVSWTVTAPEGHKTQGVRRVLIPSTAAAVVQLGSLYDPPQIPAVTAQRIIDGGTAADPLYDIRIRHDDTAGWAAEDPVLSLGEEGIDTDTGVRKVGDGVTVWSGLPASGGGGGGGGVTDHGALTGLGDDDHTQYALANGTRGAFAAALGADDNYVTDAEKAALHTHPAVIAQGATQADARTAIGLGSAATTASTAYATAAQGTTADGAAQKSANLSDLANAGTARTNLGLGTAATTAATTYATAAQGTLADSALQASTAQAINAQTGTSYTLVAGDAGKVVTLSNAGAITLNAPGSVFTAGQRVDVVVVGAGMATVVGTSGATANGTPSLVSRAQWSAFTILWTSATACIAIGDLA